MPQFIALLYTMLCCYIGGFFGIQAQAWIEHGYGLHPMLAIPACCFFLCLPLFTFGLVRDAAEALLDFAHGRQWEE